MPRSYSSIFLHIVFSTHNRAPLIERELRPRLHAYLGGIARNLGGIPICVGGVSDHVHILTTLPVTASPADLIGKLKSNSSSWAHEQIWPRTFGWQRGYGAFSVSRPMVDRVTRYIERQEEHHRKVTFQEEFIRFLKEARIEYDERYVFA